MDQSNLPLALIGSVLVLFMSVRNNAAYGRWWEARTLWGAVVNNARSFSRQTDTLARGEPALSRAMIGYVHALRGALSGSEVSPVLARFLPADFIARLPSGANQPNAILAEIGRSIARRVREQGIDGAEHAAIDRVLSDLANAQGGLERIRRTPLAIQFSLLPGLITRLFCVLLPFSLVQDMGWVTPLGSTLLGFLFVALDRIGADLENPFADNVHALPMQTITRMIEIDLLAATGEAPPPPIAAYRGVLP